MSLPRSAIIGEPDELVQLVQLARLGDDVAFEQLYLRRYRDICSFLIHLVGNEDAGRDLTHDTFLKAWQELSQLRDASRFDSWLYRIARNLAWNWLQRQRIVQWLPQKVRYACIFSSTGRFVLSAVFFLHSRGQNVKQSRTGKQRARI